MYAIENILKSRKPFQSYQLTAQKGWLGRANLLVTLKRLVGFENNFNGIYFHHHFYLKTDVKFL